MNCKGFESMQLCTNYSHYLSICLDRVMTDTVNLTQDCYCSATIQTGHFMKTSPQGLTTTPIFLIPLYCGKWYRGYNEWLSPFLSTLKNASSIVIVPYLSALEILPSLASEFFGTLWSCTECFIYLYFTILRISSSSVCIRTMFSHKLICEWQEWNWI